MSRPDRRIALYSSSSVNRGGTGVYTRRLVSGFKDAGVEGVIPIGNNQHSNGYVGKIISEHFTLPHFVRKNDFDLLHLPAFGGRTVKGIPYAVTVHDMAFMAKPGWFPFLRSIYYRLHFPRVARNASVIIADSDFTVSEIRKYLGLPAERVYLSAPLNTSTDAFFRRSYNVTGQYIFAASTIEPRKNLESLLESWPSIRKIHPNLTLVVAGRWGWGKRTVRNHLSSTEGIRWVGSISEDNLMSAFAGARLLVYPSLYEGFGLPPLESAAAGVPFVIGPADTLKEIYGKTAAAITGTAPESIANSVLDALEQTFCSDDLREFASKFSNSQMALNTYSAYKKVFA